MRSALLLALAAIVSAPAAAGAETRLIPLEGDTLRSVNGPSLLAGGRVAWLASRGADVHLTTADPGSVPRIVAQLPPSGGRPDVVEVATYELAVSDEAFAVLRDALTCPVGYDCEDYSDATRIRDLLVGVPGEQALLVAGCGFAPGEPACDNSGGQCRVYPPVIDGDVVANAERCPGAGSRVMVRRAGHVEPLRVLEGDRTQVAVAGRWLLTTERRPDGRTVTIRLSDWATGEEQLAVDVRELEGLSLQRDGTIAFAGRMGGGRRVWVAGPGRPPEPTIEHSETLETVAGGRALMVPPTERPVLIAGLDGSPPVSMTTPHRVTPVAFDGEQIAYGVRPCQADVIVVRAVGEPSPSALSARCPAPRAGGIARVEPDGRRMAVQLACPPDPLLGCIGRARIVLRTRRLGLGSRGQHALPLVDYAIPPGQTRTVRTSLPPGAARFVRRERPTRALVVAMMRRNYDDVSERNAVTRSVVALSRPAPPPRSGASAPARR